MQLPSRKSVSILCEIFVRTYESGFLSINDRYLMRTVLLEDSLDEEGQRIVNRILHAVQRNWIKLDYPEVSPEGSAAVSFPMRKCLARNLKVPCSHGIELCSDLGDRARRAVTAFPVA